jgi:hypothetical protein
MSALAQFSSLVSVRPAHRVSSDGDILCWLAFRGVLAASCFLAPRAFADDTSGAAAATVTPTLGTVVPSTVAATSKFELFPKAPVENGISFGFRAGYGFPFGSVALTDPNHHLVSALTDVTSGPVPLWFDAGYLVNPYLYLGAYFSYGILMGPSAVCGSGVTCSGGDVRFRADVQFRLLGRSAFQPWIGLGILGYERINMTMSGQGYGDSQAYDGIEWVSVQAGLDYKLLPALSAGPFIGASLGEFLGASGSVIYANEPHGWAYVGGRVNYDLHL